MGRRFVACAVLALMVSLTACRCPSWSSGGASSGGSSTGGSSTAGSSGGGQTAQKCMRGHDCTACYHGEADRDMHRLKDDLPPGGCCCDCPAPVVKHVEARECCSR
jgi:hypothetical protein